MKEHAVDLTTDAIAALAPDAASASAGRKLGRAAAWRTLGGDATTLWGECQGSALYQVRVDRATYATACSCPSHKFPCKHALGLLFIAAGEAAALTEIQQPDWAAAWNAKRAAAAERREAKEQDKKEGAVAVETAPDGKTPNKRADKRVAAVGKGLATLDLWLDDLMRGGLVSVESRPSSFWFDEASRLVDAKATGVAAQVRRMAGIPHSLPDWPARLLAALGSLALLSEAYGRIETLDPALQEDVRQAIGWTLKEDEVVAQGERVEDDWFVLGSYSFENEDDRLRLQRTWLLGVETGRVALVLQFAFGTRSFTLTLPAGARRHAVLAFWPSAYPVRALIEEGTMTDARSAALPPSMESLDAFLASVAAATARRPWLDRYAGFLAQVVPVLTAERRWLVRDREGKALPLLRGDHWTLLALSGGHPIDLAVEWDGDALRPLAIGPYPHLDQSDVMMRGGR